MKIIRYLLIALCLIVFVVGCSNTPASSSSKPDDIRQEIWDEGFVYYKLVNEKITLEEIIPKEKSEEIVTSYRKYQNLSEEETLFLECIYELTLYNAEIALAKAKNDNTMVEFLKIDYERERQKFIDKYNL